MQSGQLKRREVIALLGGAAAAWPAPGWAQAVLRPLIGWLHPGSPSSFTPHLSAFRQALSEAGYVERHNATIEYRWADGQYDRLPIMAADLIRRDVAVIVALGPPAVLAAKATNSDVPIVFLSGIDPVEALLVTSINRPGGTVTGVSTFTTEIEPKKLELLHEIIPASRIAVLVNPNNPNTGAAVRSLEAAAGALGQSIKILSANTEQALEAAVQSLTHMRANALLVAADPVFFLLRERLATLTLHHAIPTIFEYREFVATGGLMSYGSSLTDGYRQLGSYTGRILKGQKPGELPVLLPTKFELVINLKTANALGLTVPPTLLARADEVIE
jgi:putative ABC transport system substrate-binding protein